MNQWTAPAHPSLFCRTAMNYVTPDAVGSETVPVDVPVYDGRSAGLPGWQHCGFELMRHASRVQTWDDDDLLEAEHYAEMAALAKLLSGCDHALISGHIRRNPEEAARHADLGPISFVHSDFAASYGALMRDFYCSDKPEARRALNRAGIDGESVSEARRLLILQFWRNTGPATMDLPLAFCDARTVPAEDLRVIPVHDYAGGGTDFETLAVLAPARPDRHRWYVFPDLEIDETVAFRTYDSELAAQGKPFWTPHSAFPDPRVNPGQPARRSLELRATCLFL